VYRAVDRFANDGYELQESGGDHAEDVHAPMYPHGVRYANFLANRQVLPIRGELLCAAGLADGFTLRA